MELLYKGHWGHKAFGGLLGRIYGECTNMYNVPLLVDHDISIVSVL